VDEKVGGRVSVGAELGAEGGGLVMSGREVTGFALHREPVWRERANYIINAPIGDSAHTHTEQLWVRQDMASRLYEICCMNHPGFDAHLLRWEGGTYAEQV
jgi:hypothetical protein